MAASLSPDACWTTAEARNWDSQTVETWIRTNVWTDSAAEFLRMVVRSVFCCEPKHLSLLFFLQYVRGGHGIDVLTGVKGGAQAAKFRGGAHQIAVRLADTLKARILFEAPVLGVTQHDGHVEVSTAKGLVRAARAIIAIPPALASRIDFANALPARRDQLMQRLPMGTVIKVHIAYQRPFWREKGLSGMGASDVLACNVMFDQSPEDLSCGILTGFFDADAAVDYSGRGDNARRSAVIDAAATFFGPDALQPIAYVENDWMTEAWSRGCYVAHTAPGVLTTFGEALRDPCGRIHWAGTETATEWMGYMDGALQSGLRAAVEAAQAQGFSTWRQA
jgi:monoamine oxidase